MRFEAKRSVEEAVVAKKLVVVALVVVELPDILRFPVKVEEAFVKIILEVVADTPADGWVKGSLPPPVPQAVPVFESAPAVSN